MGCGGSANIGLEASMEEVKTNPVKGLADLNDNFRRRGVLQKDFRESGSAGEEICRRRAPKVFEVLTNAIGSLAVQPTFLPSDVKAITAACALIERCVKLVNDPSLGASSPAIAAKHVQQCAENLITLMKISLDNVKGNKTQSQHFMEDKECSKFVTVIAGGLEALLKLEDHAASCRNVFKLGGTEVALGCISQNSGLTLNSQQALVSMFASLLEAPESVSDFSLKGGTYALVPYCFDPKSYGASQAFQQQCMEVLEICIKSGTEVKNKAEVEDAIQKATNDVASDEQDVESEEPEANQRTLTLHQRNLLRSIRRRP